MNETEYGIVKIDPIEKFRLYIDGECINEFENEVDAIDTMNGWINWYGMSTCFDEEKYEFEEAVVCEVILMKKVVEKER